jgi:DUF177 domain-containing protein
MLVELASLERQSGKFAHNYEPRELELNEDRISIAEPPRVSGRIQQTDAKVTVSGEVTAELSLECDRCLKPLRIPVSNAFRVEYVTPDVYLAGQGAELLDDDLSLSVFNGAALDIDELVREQLLLALPAQALCREDCKGLCPVCGGDRNLKDCSCQETEVDPRWAGLKEIVSRES